MEPTHEQVPSREEFEELQDLAASDEYHAALDPFCRGFELDEFDSYEEYLAYVAARKSTEAVADTRDIVRNVNNTSDRIEMWHVVGLTVLLIWFLDETGILDSVYSVRVRG